MGTPGGHAWGVPVLEAYGVIDSVRATRRAFRDLSNLVVLVGQSQGARAVLSASALAPSYAPEFTFKAVVATGVPGGPPHARATKAPQIPVPARTGGGIHARLAVYSVFRYLALHPSFIPLEYLSDKAKPSFEAARTGCLADVDEVNRKNGVTVENTFRKLPETEMRKTASHELYPRPKFARPVFMGVGLADSTTFPEGQYNLAAAACYEGSTIELHYYPGLDHSGTVNPSLVDSLPFVRKAVAGESMPGNCATLKPPHLVR
jgi:pimeloyl-ACP methyl ester carboxylesterase